MNVLSPIAIAHADPGQPGTETDPVTLYIAPEIKADAVASQMGISLALCETGNNGDWSQVGYADLTSTNGTEINAQDAANGNWFTGDYDVRPGILVWDKADDYIGCNDLFKFGATQALGASDNITLACDVGFTRADNKDCLTDPQQTNLQQGPATRDRGKIYAALAKMRQFAVPPASNGGLSGPAEYVNVMQTLTVFCQASADANVGGPLATPTIQARDHGNEVPVVDGTGKITNVYYNIPNSGNKAMLGNFPDNFDYWEVSCGDLVGLAGRYAPAYAAYVKAHPAPANDPGASGGSNNGSTGSGQTTCVISDVGWIICPVIRFMANVTDYAYQVVSAMLVTPALDTSTSSPMYTAWSIIRNFSNVALVIVFLFIVYSQITGVGISNYGIKRMLPRLVAAAILVNVSYWICAIAIDVSNILGSSLSGLLEGTANQLYTSQSSGVGWSGLAGGVIAGTLVAGALIFAGLSVLIPLLLAALVAIIVTVIVLTARQALLTLLTAMSAAIVFAYLLPIPGIQPLGKKGVNFYLDLLLIFPTLALVFGGSKLASAIIDTPKAPVLVQIMGAGITIVPLFITPILMKITKGVLGTIGAYVNNPNRGPFDRMRKGAEGYRNNRQEYRKLKALTGYRTLPGRGVMARRKAQREAVLNNRKNELNKANADYISGMALNNEGFRGRLSQGGGGGADQRALASAISIQAKLKADEVTAATAIIKSANLEGDIAGLQKLILGDKDGNHEIEYTDASGVTRKLQAPPGSALQSAAIAAQFAIGDIPSTDAIVASSGSMGVDQRQAIAQGMQSLSKKVKYYGGSSSNAVAQGKVNNEDDLNRLVADTIEGGKYGVNELAEADHDSLKRVGKVMADPTITTNAKLAPDGTVAKPAAPISKDKKLALQDAAAEIRTNPAIKKPAARVANELSNIEGIPVV